MNLEEEDIETLLETTFCIIIQYWQIFEIGSRNLIEELLSFWIKDCKTILFNKIDRLPSLAGIEALERWEKQLGNFRKKHDTMTSLALFAERLYHENSGVVMLALEELVEYLKKNQSALQIAALGEQPDGVISSLMRALLDCASQYSHVYRDIATLCAECIGLVGCLDPSRIDTVREQKSIIVLNNFEEVEERRDFGFFLLTEVLAKSFFSVTNARMLGYLSYAIQELLERCDITRAVLGQETGHQEGADIYRKWRELSTTTQEVLTPFLSTRYMIPPIASYSAEYPIFKANKPYESWLVAFVLDLVCSPQNVNASLIFEPLHRVIRGQNMAVSEFLLPYLVVHILIGPTDSVEKKETVVQELMTILQYKPIENGNHDMRPFYEVRTISPFYHPFHLCSTADSL
jgi:serine/threonine-protein kinase ATR